MAAAMWKRNFTYRHMSRMQNVIHPGYRVVPSFQLALHVVHIVQHVCLICWLGLRQGRAERRKVGSFNLVRVVLLAEKHSGHLLFRMLSALYVFAMSVIWKKRKR